MIVSATSYRYEYDIKSLVMTFFPMEEIRYLIRERDDGEPRGEETILVLPDVSLEKWKVSYYGNGIDVWEEMENPSDGQDVKNQLKRLVYLVLSKATNRKPPWGTLTGVRPTKLPMRYLMDGHGREDAVKWMEEAFLCRRDKASLSVDVAKTERQLIRDLDLENGYSLYVGIPFCPTTCRYCSFPSFPVDRYADCVEDYLDALEKELRYVAAHLREKEPTTIYMGGGTPTTLSVHQLERLLGTLRDCFHVNGVLEFTVEAGRPDSVTRDKLILLKEHGVGRISINPQTMKQATLDAIGRKHTVREAVDAFYMAREAGFQNINVDLIMGLPEEDVADFYHTLLRIGEWNPDSVTLHSLVVKRASDLRLHKENRKRMGQTEEKDHTDEMFQTGFDFMKREGYRPYYMYRQKHKSSLTGAAFRDNVGFAKKGKEGLYNVLIMEEKQTIWAVGAGAVSKLTFPDTGRITRVENVKNVVHYIDRIDEMIARKQNIYGGIQ